VLALARWPLAKPRASTNATNTTSFQNLGTPTTSSWRGATGGPRRSPRVSDPETLWALPRSAGCTTGSPCHPGAQLGGHGSTPPNAPGRLLPYPDGCARPPPEPALPGLGISL